MSLYVNEVIETLNNCNIYFRDQSRETVATAEPGPLETKHDIAEGISVLHKLRT